ncbi:MAG: hypothetical protein ABL892_06410 [Thiobacillaceae bacterium]
MKNTILKSTLGLIALTTLGFAAPGAQADGWQNGDNRNPGYNQPDDRRQLNPMHDLREGFRFSRMVNDRQDQQMDRILAGVQADRLNKNEFIQLMQEQKTIRAMERSFMVDRFMNEAEFQRLNQALDVADGNIRMANQNHDRRNNSPRPWPWMHR